MDSRYDHQASEQRARQLWETAKAYAFNPVPGKPVFSIDTPPPTVSGSLHIGHIFSYTHTDLIARYKRMTGHAVFYPMGFDDNGLATERFVEKRNALRAHTMKRSDFIALCLKESAEAEKQFEQLWKNMGLSIDWSLLYSTIDPRARAISQRSFLDLFKKGLIFRRAEPALYCTTCRTSVAQAELDSASVASTFNTITFFDENKKALHIATTRPELLPACVAVMYHPSDTRYHYLAGKKVTTPVFGKEVPCIADEKVDPEKGTGLVMCCTFGDQTDIEWFKRHKLPFVQVVGRDGKWMAETGDLAGLNVHDARKKIIELLEAAGCLIEKKPITHNVSTHERCKQEIEYLILNQWFVDVLNNKQKFIEMGNAITWKPAFMKARYDDWVNNLSWDWCISRQRFFGIPFPVWHCQSCKEVLCATPDMLPLDPQEQAYGKPCSKCGGTDIVGETDVMDTWNTSSLTPQINCNWPENKPISLPMSMRPQAHDIIRTWAFDTIVKAYYHEGIKPWDAIVISGHVLAGKEKISKSQGNASLTPDSLLTAHSADAIRYWSASGKLGTDTAFSENQLAVGARLITKLWNACRFIKEHRGAVKPARPEKMDAVNAWIMHELALTSDAYHASFKEFDYQQALDGVEKFFWKSFCDNYLELIKDRLFNPALYDEATLAATRYVLYEAGFALVQLYAPFLPHATEILYQELYKEFEGGDILHLTQIDPARLSAKNEEAASQCHTIIGLVAAVRKLKSEQQLSLKAPLKELIIASKHPIAPEIAAQEQLFKGIAHAEKVLFVHGDLLHANELTGVEGSFVMTVVAENV